MELLSPEDYEETVTEAPVPRPYRTFRDGEGIPVHEGLVVSDLADLETGPWHRTGQSGAFVNLLGMEGVNDIHLHDIEPGGETDQQRHMYDEIVYVLHGQGASVIGTGDDRHTFEWGEGALFAIPRNATYRHVNIDDAATARLVCQTSLPSWFNVANEDLIFDCEYDPWGSEGVDPDFYSGEGELGTLYEGKYDDAGGVTAWFSHFIPDVNAFDRFGSWGEKMGGMRLALVPFPDISMHAHLSELPVGLYKKAHRHRPGANVIMRAGREGYTLLWKPEWEDKKIRVDWKKNTLFTPPAYWFHHHFNLDSEPAGQLAGHFPQLGALSELGLFDPHNPDNIIEYTEEEPAIRELYESELAERGLTSSMPEACYSDDDFVFEL